MRHDYTPLDASSVFQGDGGIIIIVVVYYYYYWFFLGLNLSIQLDLFRTNLFVIHKLKYNSYVTSYETN